MDNKKWLVALLVAFIAGYFSNDFINGKITDIPEKLAETNVKQSATTQTRVNTVAASVVTSSTSSIEKRQSSLPSLRPQENMENGLPQATLKAPAENSIGSSHDGNSAGEITDEEIDILIPSPFNQSLKNHHGDLRKKFKQYADAETADEWNMSMQNKISDFILSNPYSKFISLEFISCKADLCELRVFEKKKGTWSHISSDMALQDWWDIGGRSASGDAVDGKPGITAWYILFQKK